MAKRKAARKTSTPRGGTRKRPVARKAASRKKTARRAAGGRKTATARKASGARKGSTARKRSTARKAPRVRTSAARKGSSGTRKASVRKAPARSSSARKGGATAVLPLRKAPNLNRPRRRVEEDDLVPTPPSSLDLDRSASSTRSGRKELRERYSEHTETSPALTGGDVDADWESAYSVGDEAPGGDNPTPDQDIVDDIGRAVGVEYQDNEELKGADKVAKRDKNRWELDPASSDDWDDR